MRNSLAIKNLSIALEALSRIPNSAQLSRRIENLLKHALTEEETQQRQNKSDLNLPLDLDEEIPF